MIYESFIEKTGVIWAVMGLARYLHFLRRQGTPNIWYLSKI